MAKAKTEVIKSNPALSEAIAALEKQYGAGIVRRYGDSPMKIERTSSGILSLDLALGGGFPRGSIVEIYGGNMGGKTAIATKGLIEIQKQSRKDGVIDLENTYDPDLAANNGMDVNDLFICNPDSGEQAFTVAEALANTGEFGGLLFDSVASAMPQGEGEKDMGATNIGMQAKMMSQCLRRINPVLHRNGCTMFFINQVRTAGIGTTMTYDITSGGRALAFYASIRMEVKVLDYIDTKGNYVKTKEGSIGHRIKVKIVKNKYSPPFKTAEFDLIYGVGFDLEKDLLEVAVALDVIHKSSSWFSYKDLKEQGLPKIIAAIKNAGLYDSVRQETMDVINGGNYSVAATSSEDSDDSQ